MMNIDTLRVKPVAWRRTDTPRTTITENEDIAFGWELDGLFYEPLYTGEQMSTEKLTGSKPGYLAEVRDCGSGDVNANAKLIAAAPDLLQALQYAVGQVPELATVPGVAAALAMATGHDA